MRWAAEDLKPDQRIRTEWVDISNITKPYLMDVFEYWDHVRGDKFAPSLLEFRLEDLPPKIVPYMVIVDILGSPIDFYYRFFGTKMVENAGFDMSRKSYFADKVEGYGFVNAEIFPHVIKERKPLCTLTSWISIKGLRFSTTTMRFPISKNGKDVTHAVSVNHFELATGNQD